MKLSMRNLGHRVFLVAASLAAIAASPCRAGDDASRPPNVLFLIADDLGWRDVGYHGSEIRTPNLDRLAKLGVRLERHYVAPTCSPTRAGILTGRSPSRFGIHAPIGGRSTDALPPETMTLARALQKRGYETALSGKWHLGLRPDVGPRKYGFDQSYGYFHGQLDQLSHRYKNGDRTWHRNDEFLDEPGHATDLIAAEATRFLLAPRKSPFFLWVAFSVPHAPLQEEDRWTDPYADAISDSSRRLFAASVTHMDAAIGTIVEALENSGQAENTLIVFSSDNGGQRDYASKTDYEGKYGPYATLGDNRPWRGWKTELYEGGIRVPAFAVWKGKLTPRIEDRSVTFLDWFPTLCRVAGIDLDAAWKLEGRDAWPILENKGEPAPEPVRYWNIGPQKSVIQGDWKLIVTGGKSPRDELYSLKDDPAEEKNLAAGQPERVAALKGELNRQAELDP